MATRAAKVPLHGDAENLAEKMNAHARELGIQCSTLAVQGIELAGGKQPPDLALDAEAQRPTGGPRYEVRVQTRDGAPRDR
jgi:hypothetical protein